MRLQSAGVEGGMSTYDPHGALQKVPFVQYLSGAELFSFAQTLGRVTVAEGALPPTMYKAAAPPTGALLTDAIALPVSRR